jgi:hypothetical protein
MANTFQEILAHRAGICAPYGKTDASVASEDANFLPLDRS